MSRTHDSADISCKSPPEGNRGAPTLSAAIGISVLAHAAAIGALLMLMLRPAPPLATPLDAIEVSVVPEEALARPRENNRFNGMGELTKNKRVRGDGWWLSMGA